MRTDDFGGKQMVLSRSLVNERELAGAKLKAMEKNDTEKNCCWCMVQVHSVGAGVQHFHAGSVGIGKAGLG